MYAEEYKLLGGNAEKMKSTMDALQVIREGLPVSMIDEAVKVLNLTKMDLVPLIGANIRSVQRNKGAHLTPQQSEHTLAMVGVLQHAAEYFGDINTAREWLKSQQVIFGNKSAIDYFDTMTGIEYVNDIINRMKHGMTA